MVDIPLSNSTQYNHGLLPSNTPLSSEKIKFQIKGCLNSSSFEDGHLRIKKNLTASYALQMSTVKPSIGPRICLILKFDKNAHLRDGFHNPP